MLDMFLAWNPGFEILTIYTYLYKLLVRIELKTQEPDVEFWKSLSSGKQPHNYGLNHYV